MTGYQTPTDLESVADREIKRLRAELARVTAERDAAKKHLRDANKGSETNAKVNRALADKMLALQAELAEARKDAERYQTVRRMHVAAFSEAYKVNISTGKPFDEIIDDLRPFYFGPAKGDA